KRRYAAAVQLVRDAYPGWDPVGARVGAEVAVEGPVLLHDHHDVLDLLDPHERECRRAPRPQRCRNRHAEQRPDPDHALDHHAYSNHWPGAELRCQLSRFTKMWPAGRPCASARPPARPSRWPD